MSLHFHWFLPTNGDGRDIVGGGHGVATGSAGAIRPASLSYLGQIARSAEQLGFEGALTPTGAWCEDAWLATGMLTEVTERLKFLVAFRPGLTSPLLAAQMAATFQRYSKGRLLLNVVTGGESAEQRAYGDFLDKDAALPALRRVPRHRPAALERRDASAMTVSTCAWRAPGWPGGPTRYPPLYFGGSSPAAGPVAARYTDVYLTWGEPPAAVDAKLRWMDGLAQQAGRTLRYGIRLHVITRDTSHEAWLQANRLIEGIDESMIAKVQQGLAHQRIRGAAADARAARRLAGQPGGLAQPVGRRRPAARRRGHRPGRQPHRGRRPDRGVRRARHLRVHPVRVPAPGGGLLVRRRRAAHPARARPLAASRARHADEVLTTTPFVPTAGPVQPAAVS